MINGKNVTSKVKNEKKGIRCFNALLKIESYMLDQNLREFKQRAEKDYYSEYFIYDRTREDCLTFRCNMNGAISALQMAELITAQESENMLKKVQEQAEIIKNRYFPPAERNKEQEVCFLENSVNYSEERIVTAVVLDTNLYDSFDGYDLRDFPGKCTAPLQKALNKLNSGEITEQEFCRIDLSGSYVENGLSHDLNYGLGMEFHDVDCLRQEIKSLGDVDGVFKITTYQYDGHRDDIREGTEADVRYCAIDGAALEKALKIPSWETRVQYVMVDEKNKNKTVSDGSNSPVSLNLSNQKPVETLQLGGTGAKKSKRKM